EALRDKAAGKGTDTHALAEIVAHAYMRGESISDAFLIGIAKAHEPLVSPEVLELTGRIRDWFLTTRPRIISAEHMVVCLVCGYGATLDLDCEIDGVPWVIDVKTGGGIYESMALQLTAQAHALEHTIIGRPLDHYLDLTRKTAVLWANDRARNGCELVEL